MNNSLRIKLEQCPMCDGDTRPISKERYVKDCPVIKYHQIALECKDCYFSFVTDQTSSMTLNNREWSITMYDILFRFNDDDNSIEVPNNLSLEEFIDFINTL